MQNSIQVKDTPISEIQRIFELQKANKWEVARSSVKERRAKLAKLKKCILKYRDEIRLASKKDQSKPHIETDITEIYQITSEINHARRELSEWMKKHSVKTPLSLFGASSHFQYEPKGCTLIISPWNFPFNLSFCPMVSAIAAGNTAIVKPSENTPHASQLIKKIVEEIFDEKEVAVVEGGKDSSTALLNLPFNHIFFTGSSKVGKIVMKAAAEHLASVTLELGGKSPTIVDETANLNNAAKRIVWGKFLNNGQICIASDHVFVHEKVKDKFIEKLKFYIEKFYSTEEENSESYGRIVNENHYDRVSSYIKDADRQNGKIIYGGSVNAQSNYIQPTIIEGLSEEAELMKEEIFGPILPIIPFDNIEKVIQEINAKEKPLALYIYSDKSSNCDYIIQNTRAGGTVINNGNIQFSNGNLPFGGVNNSGTGKSHGFFGFTEFSNARAVMKQHVAGLQEMIFPPYNSFKQKLVDFTIKWL